MASLGISTGWSLASDDDLSWERMFSFKAG